MRMKAPLRLPLQKAKEMFDGDEVTVLDVLDADAYARAPHEIPGAWRIDPEEIEAEYRHLPQEHAILTYCTCDNDEISAKVAYFLRKQGFDAYAIEGGLHAWQDAGYPLREKELAAST